MTALIDTCIIIDVLQNRQPFAEDAVKVLIAAADRKCTEALTAKSVTDIFYITHHFLHDEAETRRQIQKLFTLFEVVDTNAMDCRLALESPVKNYEDAVMIETAKRIKADCIVTRNLKDYSQSKAEIPVYSPREFLEASASRSKIIRSKKQDFVADNL